MKNDKVLVVQYAKWPELGKVKTRIAKTVGDKKALNIHLELLKIVRANLANSGSTEYQMWLSHDGFSHGDETTQKLMSDILQSDLQAYQVQRGKDLGARMANTFLDCLSFYSKVIIVGSDCPNVTGEVIEKACVKLDDFDMVMQPAEDGGYVLIGARRFEKNTLDNIEWGQGYVLHQTLKNLDEAGLSYALLEQSWDVDEYEDYLRWQEN